MYFNDIFVVGTSIIQGPLLKSGVPPPRSSGELIISHYPAEVFIDKKFQLGYGVHFHLRIQIKSILKLEFLE